MSCLQKFNNDAHLNSKVPINHYKLETNVKDWNKSLRHGLKIEYLLRYGLSDGPKQHDCIAYFDINWGALEIDYESLE